MTDKFIWSNAENALVPVAEGSFNFQAALAGKSSERTLPSGIFIYLTGYFMSYSMFFSRELRYQKTKESKRKKPKITTSLSMPFPFFPVNCLYHMLSGHFTGIS